MLHTQNIWPTKKYAHYKLIMLSHKLKEIHVLYSPVLGNKFQIPFPPLKDGPITELFVKSLRAYRSKQYIYLFLSTIILKLNCKYYLKQLW